MMKKAPKAYSYVRFSTPEQMKGDSLRRQTEAAARYAKLHGLELDDTLTFRDLGVSAFRGGNEEIGHLGEFLAFVESGDVPQGSYLLVESMDRLSRQVPRRAIRTLERICEAGVAVVTLADGRVYTTETIDNEPMALMWLLVVAMRGHEESATKSKRVREAWSAKRRKAVETGEPLSALCPGWIRLSGDRTTYELIPERAEIVRSIFRWSREGVGQHAIAGRLNETGVPVFGRGKHWHRSYVKKLLASPATYGEFTPHEVAYANGKRIRMPTEAVEGYFPAVIDRETFRAVQAGKREPTAARRGDTVNMLAGLAKCPLCGSTMTRVNKGRRKKAGRPYLVCTKAKTGAGCEYHAVRQEYIEDAIGGGAEELVAGMPSPNDELQRKWEAVGREIDALECTIRNALETLERAPLSKALAGHLAANERTLEDARLRHIEIEEQIVETMTNRAVGLAQGAFLDAIQAGDVPAINKAMRQLFERVTVDYRTGFLDFDWKHAPGSKGSIFFSWPKETH
jgi:DNA invertase Pin-like site-specific DNA recombinase